MKFIILALPFLLLISCESSQKKSESDSKKVEIPKICKTKCVTPYEKILGTSPTGVEAYSNCKSECVIFTPHKQDGVYTGIKWQCVEYSRRWLIKNKQLTYGSVDFASDIWSQVKFYTHSKTKKKYPVENIKNGDKTLPKVGELLVYEKAFKGTGHVAVISKIDTKNKLIYVVEENFFNKPWPGNYARKLKYKKVSGKYKIQDKHLLGWQRIL